MATHSMHERIAELRKRSAEAMLGGGAERLDKQRKSGKVTARERVDALVDPGSFEESGLVAEHRANDDTKDFYWHVTSSISPLIRDSTTPSFCATCRICSARACGRTSMIW